MNLLKYCSWTFPMVSGSVHLTGALNFVFITSASDTSGKNLESAHRMVTFKILS